MVDIPRNRYLDSMERGLGVPQMQFEPYELKREVIPVVVIERPFEIKRISDNQTVGTSSTIDIRVPVGKKWHVTQFYKDATVAVANVCLEGQDGSNPYYMLGGSITAAYAAACNVWAKGGDWFRLTGTAGEASSCGVCYEEYDD